MKKVEKLHADFKFLDGHPEKPMLFLGKSLSTSKIVSLLFNPGPGMLSTKQPLKVKKECCFLVDLRRISLEDLRADGNPPYDRCEFFDTSFILINQYSTYRHLYKHTEPRNR